MDLGIIGNCQYMGLIDAWGEVRWLCWPRFDSSFVFGSLLDRQKAGCFRISPEEGSKGKQEYIINSNVLRTVFTTPRGSFETLDFAPRYYLFNDTYYKPLKLIRLVRPLEGEPRVCVKLEPVYHYGKSHYRALDHSHLIAFEGEGPSLNLATNASLTYIHSGQPFVLDKGYYFELNYGQGEYAASYLHCEEACQKTIDYWQRWVKHCYLPRDYQEQVIRSALVLKLHQYEDTGAIIASATTSIPEAHLSGRNWDYRYCWLRDAWFSLAALHHLTQFEEMEKFVLYLRNRVEDMDKGQGGLQPVYGVGGERQLTETILEHLEGYQGNQPVRIGNQAYEHLQHDVYGEMILAISPLFLDKRFHNTHGNFPLALLRKLLDKIEAYATAKDAGIWEFRGNAQLHTFSVLMHWAGSAMALEIGMHHGYEGIIKQTRQLNNQCAKIINEQCWHEKLGCFVQATNNGHLDAALLMLINLGFLQADDPRARRHVEATAKFLQAQNGLLHRYVAADDFGDTKNAFIICSFWLAEAYGHLGMHADGRTLFERLLTYANPLGLYSEDLDPNDASQWGNFPQTYSHVGLINAAFVLSRSRGVVNWPQSR